MRTFLRSRRPRQFRHEMIYCDERKEMLRQARMRAKEKTTGSSQLGDEDRGRHIDFTANAQKWRANRNRQRRKVHTMWTLLLMLIVLVLLMMI